MAQAQTLTVTVGGKAATLDVAQLRKQLPVEQLTLKNPAYEDRRITYRGFWLNAVLEHVGGPKFDPDVLTFTCKDGYQPTVSLSKNPKLKLFLAFSESTGGWLPLEHKGAFISPGPFYVVGAKSADYKTFAWPYQVVAIESTVVAKTYPKLEPTTDAEGVTAGHGLFIQHCVACHSINLQGGTVGPELNIPKSVTEYRDRGTLKAFIKDARSFRARTGMLQFTHLTDPELEALLDYLTHMATLKR